MTVDVILPCLNEASALPWVLRRMPAGRFAARARELAPVLGLAGAARPVGAAREQA
ncbi:MAG: hypothetical protein ACRDPY_46310 [Streptosporangiaceae bacterium]